MKPLFLFTFSIYCLFLLNPGRGQGQPIHQVQKGETLYTIAKKYKLSIQDIKKWNDLISSVIQVGQLLKLSLATIEKNDGIHIVKPKETLFGIAKQYGISNTNLITWNNLSEDNLILKTNQRLYTKKPADGIRISIAQTIGQKDKTTEPTQPDDIKIQEVPLLIHTIKAGETLFSISKTYSVNITSIKKWNDIHSNTIYPGRKLRIATSYVQQKQLSPPLKQPPNSFHTYTVQLGDTRESIIIRLKMNEDEWQALNPTKRKKSLKEGEKIMIITPPTVKKPNPYLINITKPSKQTQKEIALVYHNDERGVATTTGELYNPTLLTAAHAYLPLGNIYYIENPYNGIGFYIRINDRTPQKGIKLSHKAYALLRLNYNINQINIYSL